MYKPIIAAVNGLALGGGFEAALACDLIIADENAQFGLPEVKIGLAALAGGLQRLPRQIGLKSAMGLALTGRTFDAKEARGLGCINEIAPAGGAVPAARRWAAEIMEAAPLAVWAAKQTMLHGLREPDLSTAMRRQEQYPAVLAMRALRGMPPRAYARSRSDVRRGGKADDASIKPMHRPSGSCARLRRREERRCR